MRLTKDSMSVILTSTGSGELLDNTLHTLCKKLVCKRPVLCIFRYCENMSYHQKLLNLREL